MVSHRLGRGSLGTDSGGNEAGSEVTLSKSVPRRTCRRSGRLGRWQTHNGQVVQYLQCFLRMEAEGFDNKDDRV